MIKNEFNVKFAIIKPLIELFNTNALSIYELQNAS